MKIRVSYDSTACRLVTGPAGRVIGVETRQGGNTVRIGASRAVILASGGFEYDEWMKLNYLPVHPTYFTGHPSATGDGIRLAQAVGADLWHMNCVSGRMVAKFPECPVAFRTSLDGMSVRGKPSVPQDQPEKMPGYVIVDRNGLRYTNEDFKSHSLYYELTVFDTHRLVYPRVPSYWVFDRRRMDLDSLVGVRSGAAGPRPFYQWSRDNSAELEKGWIFTGASVRALADNMGLPADNLERSINSYNACCLRGKDPDFGRKPAGLVPLDAPPFFAIAMWPGGPNTQGGPRRNARSQVMNTDGSIIPGLYGAGEMGSIYGMLYPGGGGNLTECIALGRAAGEDAAREPRA